jgi:hypothetical protein
LLNIIAGSLSVGVTPSTNSYESIASTTVGSGGSATITFSSIPATYTHLQIRAIVRSQRVAPDETLRYEFNGDTSSTTSSAHLIQGNGSSVIAAGAANYFNLISDFIPASQIGSNIYGVVITDILDYANTNKNKTVRTLFGFDNNGGGYNGHLQFLSNGWRNTNAITSITIASTTSSTMAEYTQFALYGIKGV